MENQQHEYKVHELTARLQASQQETELIQTLISPHIAVATSQSLPTLTMESSNATLKAAAAQKTTKVNIL